MNRKVVISGFPEVSALGAAYMAGLKTGVYTGLDQLQQLKLVKDTLAPTDIDLNKKWYEGWKEQLVINNNFEISDLGILRFVVR